MKTFIAAVLAIAVLATGALAQSTDGAFSKLSPGNQKIVQALFEAQKTGTGTTPLTVDQIAAKKTDGGWGQAFKDMKAAGLMGDYKNLGQVVSSYERKHPETAKADTSKAGKPDKAEKPVKPDKPEKMDKMEKPEKPERGRH